MNFLEKLPFSGCKPAISLTEIRNQSCEDDVTIRPAASILESSLIPYGVSSGDRGSREQKSTVARDFHERTAHTLG